MTGASADWGDQEHLLATVIDELRGLWYTYVAAHTPKGKGKPKKPQMIKRPGVKAKKGKRRMSLAEMQEKLHSDRWVDAGVKKVIDGNDR